MALRPIIIDCDPGQDDAIAIFLALAAPDLLEVRGITTVVGNVPLAKTARNARLLVELAGRPEIPVLAGCRRPLVRPAITAEYVHGPEGINGIDIGEPKLPLASGHAVDFLIESLIDAAGDGITLVPIGPLTNIAMALVKAPEILPRIKEIVIMGGAYREGGNWRPSAEFNILADPHAAHVVLGCGRPITLMGLDVTHQARTSRQRLQRIAALANPVARAATGLLNFYHRDPRERYGEEGAPLHDPLTIAYLLAPALFEGREVNVEVDIMSELSMGTTCVDFYGVTDRPRNVFWIESVDADGFYDLLTERLRRYASLEMEGDN